MTFKGSTKIAQLPSSSIIKAKSVIGQLVILRQHSLEVEQFVENGQPKSVHYVIKNSAFVLEVALRGMERVSSTFTGTPPVLEGETLDFNKITLEASLLYDCRDEKEVACVKVQPLTYRGIVKKSNPSVCYLEATVKVLSSQHEDMNFKLKFTAVDNQTKRPIPEIAPVFSEPLQVISKPEVLKKKNQPRSTTPRKNKTKSELILETLARIEATQALQQKQIDNIIGGDKKSGSTEKLPKLGKRAFGETTSSSVATKSLELAYQQFLSAYRALPLEERPTKIQKIVASGTESDHITWNTIVGHVKEAEQKNSSSLSMYCQPELSMVDHSNSSVTSSISLDPADDIFSLNSDQFLATLGF